MFRAKIDDPTSIVERSATHTLLSVLNFATALGRLSENDDGVRSVHDKVSSFAVSFPFCFTLSHFTYESRLLKLLEDDFKA